MMSVCSNPYCNASLASGAACGFCGGKALPDCGGEIADSTQQAIDAILKGVPMHPDPRTVRLSGQAPTGLSREAVALRIVELYREERQTQFNPFEVELEMFKVACRVLTEYLEPDAGVCRDVCCQKADADAAAGSEGEGDGEA